MTHSMDSRAWLLFTAVAVLMGVPYLFTSIALEDLGAVTVAAVRVFIGGLLLAPLLMRRRHWEALFSRRGKLAVLAVLEVVLPFTLIAMGQQTVPSGTTGVIIATEPLFIAALAPLLIPAARLSWVGWVGLFTGLFGVIVLLGLEFTTLGAFLILIAAASYALGAILLDHWFADLDTLVVVAAMLITAVPQLLLAAALIDGAPMVTPSSAMAVLALGAACTAGTFAAFFALIRRVGAPKAGPAIQVAPIVALIAGVLFLGETLTAWQLLGCALILTGAAMVLLPKKAQQQAPA